MMNCPIIAIIISLQAYAKKSKLIRKKPNRPSFTLTKLSRYIEEQERIREQFGQIEKSRPWANFASGVAHDSIKHWRNLGRGEFNVRRANDADTRRGLEIIIQAPMMAPARSDGYNDFARQRRDHDFPACLVDHLLIDVNEITRPRWKDRAQAHKRHIKLNLQINTKASLGRPL